MSLLQTCLKLVRKYGVATKVVASGVLNVVAPRSNTLVDLAGQAIEAASHASEGLVEEQFRRELLARVNQNEAELARLEQLLEFLVGPLAKVCDQAAKFANQPHDLPDIVNRAIAADPSLNQVLHQIGNLKEQFAVFQADIRRLADRQDEADAELLRQPSDTAESKTSDTKVPTVETKIPLPESPTLLPELPIETTKKHLGEDDSIPFRSDSQSNSDDPKQDTNGVDIVQRPTMMKPKAKKMLFSLLMIAPIIVVALSILLSKFTILFARKSNQEDPEWQRTAVSDQKTAPPNNQSYEWVPEWQKAGAEIGWMGQDSSGSLRFQEKADGLMQPIRTFRFSKWQEPTIPNLPEPDEAFGLDLSNTGINDAGLKEVAKLKGLQLLDLSFTEVTDAGLKELNRLPRLQSLSLRNTEVTDTGLKELAKLNSLQSLHLGNTQVTDMGLKELAKLTNLQSLYLWNIQVTDTGLKELTKLPSLQQLYLDGTRVTDTGLIHLVKLTNLQTLYLYDTKVTDAGLKELTGLKLKTLKLPEQAQTDLGLKHYLAATETPSELDLTRWEVTDAGLKELKGLTRLQSLYIGGTQVTDAGLKELKGLTRLQTLYLFRTRVTDEGLKELKGLTSLQSLHLADTQITDEGLIHLVNLMSLKELYLADTQVTDAGLMHLTGLPHLQTLHLAFTRVTDEGLHELAKLTGLQLMHLGGTRVTDEGLKNLKGLTRLQELYLTDTQITDEGIRLLKQALPNCNISK